MARWVEFGSSMRAIGITYSSTMYALRERSRPLVSIDLYFVKIWLSMPWRHVQPKELGAGVRSWGIYHTFGAMRGGHFSWGETQPRFQWPMRRTK